MYLFTNFVIIFFLIKKNKKLHSIILISFFIIFTSIFYFKSIELINIFYFKNLSATQKTYITKQNLFQKFNIYNYQSTRSDYTDNHNLNDLRIDAIKESQNKFLNFNYYGKDSFSFKSDRWNEYKSFFQIFYEKYFLNQSNENFNSYYHNFYMNEFARLGFSSFFLITYIFLLNFINFKSSLKTKKMDNICLSVIYLTIFFYISLFDAFLPANLRSLILLIIILFILNKYNERNTEKI